MDKSNKQQNNLVDEAVRVELTSKAGGYITRELVRKAEEMLVNKPTV